MSLLSKLFGDKKGLVSDLIDLVQGAAAQGEKPAHNASSVCEPWATSCQAASSKTASEEPSGFSWGKQMPNEPNQYNYYGTFWEYFEDIFRREFADYSVERQQNPRCLSVYTYGFTKNAESCLVVELLSEHNEVYKVRHDCQKQGIPYLRFYYDHDGWWNTRAYVTERMRKALG